MTVAQLIQRLQKLDPRASLVLEVIEPYDDNPKHCRGTLADVTLDPATGDVLLTEKPRCGDTTRSGGSPTSPSNPPSLFSQS